MHTCVIAYAHAMRIDVHVLLQCYYPRIIAVEAPPLAAPQLASLDDPTYSVKSEILGNPEFDVPTVITAQH